MSSPEDALRALLEGSAVASLATLEDGHPAASLAPYVALRDPVRLYLLVSDLSAHTGALRRDSRCAWMVSDAPREGDPRSNHALTRAMAKATARFITRDEARALGVEAAYRAKYPIAETLLGLADFHFVELATVEGSAGFVQGFGRAYAVRGANLDALEHIKTR